jgi:hypothetical protein
LSIVIPNQNPNYYIFNHFNLAFFFYSFTLLLISLKCFVAYNTVLACLFTKNLKSQRDINHNNFYYKATPIFIFKMKQAIFLSIAVYFRVTFASFSTSFVKPNHHLARTVSSSFCFKLSGETCLSSSNNKLTR